MCRQLGYSAALRVVPNGRYGSVHSDVPIWMDDVACTGSEMRIQVSCWYRDTLLWTLCSESVYIYVQGLQAHGTGRYKLRTQ